MSNKTPYEIRLEVLQMAKDYFDKIHAANLAFAQEAFLKAIESQRLTQDQIDSYIPQIYTIDDVMKKAAEFYAFVQKRD